MDKDSANIFSFLNERLINFFFKNDQKISLFRLWLIDKNIVKPEKLLAPSLRNYAKDQEIFLYKLINIEYHQFYRQIT